MVAQFHVVVGRRRGRATQAEWRLCEALCQRQPRLAVERLEDAALVEHYPAEVDRVEVAQPLVVRDVDAGFDLVTLADMASLNPELLALAHELRRHGQRR